MSTNSESLINGNYCEIMKDQATKMSDDTIVSVNDTFSNRNDLPASEITGNFVLETKKCPEDEENDSEIAKIIDIIKENGIVKNMQTSGNTNGTTNTESDEIKTTNNEDIYVNSDNDLVNNQPDVSVAEAMLTDKIIDATTDEVSKPIIELNVSDANIENISNTLDISKLEEPSEVAENSEHKLEETTKKEINSDKLSDVNLQNSEELEMTDIESKTADTENEEINEKFTSSASRGENISEPDGSNDIKIMEVHIETSSKQNDPDSLQINYDITTEPEKLKPVMNLQTNDDTNLNIENSVVPAKVYTNSVTKSNLEESEGTNDLQINEITETELEKFEPVKEPVSTKNDNIKESDEEHPVTDSKSTNKSEGNVEKIDLESKNITMQDKSDLNTIDSSDEKDEENSKNKIENNLMETDTEVINLENENEENSKNKIENNLMETDTEVINLENETSMETDDTETLNLIEHKIDEIMEKTLDSCGDKAVESQKIQQIDKESPMEVDNVEIEKKTDKLELEVEIEISKRNESEENVIICDDIDNTDEIATDSKNNNTVDSDHAENSMNNKEDIKEEEDVTIIEKDDKLPCVAEKEKSPEKQVTKNLPVVCKLSNTLDFLSDDEEEATKKEATDVSKNNISEEKPCYSVDDDDDIMLIEEDSTPKESVASNNISNNTEEPKADDNIDLETGENQATNITDLMPKTTEKDTEPEQVTTPELDSKPGSEEKINEDSKSEDKKKPLLPSSFLKTAKKNLADMSRHELEDFCILRIVESIVDRSNLSDIKTKIKTMAQNLEEYRKKTLMLTKQNRDLQVVLKSVQEEQKKRINGTIQPLKITRSVGMQVLMTDKLDPRRKMSIPTPPQAIPAAIRPVRSVTLPKQTKPPGTPPNTIPVPRKVPVSNSPVKVMSNATANSIGNKSTSPSPVTMRNNPSPVQKPPEKRTHSRMQASCSVTVDLTDDEPPAKINNKNSTPPVRVVPSHNLLAQNRPLNNTGQAINTPRKVYIPISAPQSLRSGQTVMLKNVPAQGNRQRMPSPRTPNMSVRPKLFARHPAPLPDAMKQYTPPTWKNLPPAPDLKLSKVENGIVISWKIDGYPEGAYETIASYQLYAYQETSAPPSTAHWKKIGDVKALPLPMACTLTQFMAGFKYYFAVRAVDIRSRLGPFSLPGSILLLNQM